MQVSCALFERYSVNNCNTVWKQWRNNCREMDSQPPIWSVWRRPISLGLVSLPPMPMVWILLLLYLCFIRKQYEKSMNIRKIWNKSVALTRNSYTILLFISGLICQGGFMSSMFILEFLLVVWEISMRSFLVIEKISEAV